MIEAGRESVMSDYLASHTVPLPDFSTQATESEEDGKSKLDFCEENVQFLLSTDK